MAMFSVPTVGGALAGHTASPDWCPELEVILCGCGKCEALKDLCEILDMDECGKERGDSECLKETPTIRIVRP